MSVVFRVDAYEYIHVEDRNSCDIFTLVGPLCSTLLEHHHPVQPHPLPCVTIPPNHYVRIRNPVRRSADPAPTPSTTTTTTTPVVVPQMCRCSSSGSEERYPLICHDPTMLARFPARGRCTMGEVEYRFHQRPFPLFPGEELETPTPLPMPLLSSTEALVLRARHAHTATTCSRGTTKHVEAGEVFLFRGPGIYTPTAEAEMMERQQAVLVQSGEVLHLRARMAFVEVAGDDDHHRTPRVAGEEWFVRGVRGSYFVDPQTELLQRISPSTHIISSECALHLRATKTHEDVRVRRARTQGEEWLLTHEDVADGFVPCDEVELVATVKRTVLASDHYCIIMRTDKDGVHREQRVGPSSFFLQPNETLVSGDVLQAYNLRAGEALLVVATESFDDVAHGTRRIASTRWLERGPMRYVPPLPVRVLERREVILLNHNSGVYVRNVQSGCIRRVSGAPLMLSEEEELWEKPLHPLIKHLLKAPRLSLRGCDVATSAGGEVDVLAASMNVGAMERGGAQDDRGKHKKMDKWSSSSSSASSSCSNYGISEMLHEPKSRCDDDHGKLRGGASALAANPRCGTCVVAQPPPTSSFTLQQQQQQQHHHVELSTAETRARIAKASVISINIEGNTLVRLYDTSCGTSRVVAGPASIFLEPHEEFTPVALSGGRPKMPAQIHSLALYLGPDYMADRIEVETLDHARLHLHVAYNWEFDARNRDEIERIAFTIPDFVGEACKTLASRVRATIAGVSFEDFHRNSSSLIRQAIFASQTNTSSSSTATTTTTMCTSSGDGPTTRGGGAEVLRFDANGLLITNVDVQYIEPVDITTRTALTKSVQLAVEILTKAQENEATHHAELLEQEAKGALELQTICDRASAEEQRIRLARVAMENAMLEHVGASRAQALAESEAQLVEATAELRVAPLQCDAHERGVDAEMVMLQQRMSADVAHRRAMSELAVAKAKMLAEVEAAKYENIMSSVGQDTIVAIAQSGPEMQAKLLNALGLSGYLITDGSAPVNLLRVAQDIIAH